MSSQQDLRDALEALLEWAERFRASDPKLDSEEWYRVRDFARVVLRGEMVRCKNCSEDYDPGDKSDPTYGAFVGPRYCGYCGAQEARIADAQ